MTPMSMNPSRTTGRKLIWSAALAVLAGCSSVGPTHQRPGVDTPIVFKQGAGVWVPATPADTLDRGPWWELFGDPVLSELEQRVVLDNQNVAQAVAAYAQARALVAEQRGALLPRLGLDLGSSRRGGGGDTPGSGSYQVGIGASWEPDLWGRLGRAVDAARSGEQASAADLAGARLSAQGELAANYFALRGLDVQRSLLAETITGYQRNLQITQNRYT
ncbi:MAG: TolC family protein, partial [Caulobacter sp.]|nr:TolC family protein [Vitreoscilla sp.]